ncbi:hypothetical protein AALA36_09930 [Lachnospiraceae bacterium 66-29]
MSGGHPFSTDRNEVKTQGCGFVSDREASQHPRSKNADGVLE